MIILLSLYYIRLITTGVRPPAVGINIIPDSENRHRAEIRQLSGMRGSMDPTDFTTVTPMPSASLLASTLGLHRLADEMLRQPGRWLPLHNPLTSLSDTQFDHSIRFSSLLDSLVQVLFCALR
jgi:hypothetical protein